jgi:hypothetical protein
VALRKLFFALQGHRFLNPLPARHPKWGVEKNNALPDTPSRVSGYFF